MSTQIIPLDALLHASSHMAGVYMRELSQDEMRRFNEVMNGPLRKQVDDLMKYASKKPDGMSTKEWGTTASLRSLALSLTAAAHIKGRDHFLANINPGMKSEPFKASCRHYGVDTLADLLSDTPKADRRRQAAPVMDGKGLI